jgi:hypothetical protein
VTTEPVSAGRVGRSLIAYRIAGREYPMTVVSQCKVCMSPHRFDIEKELVSGRTYKKIAEGLPDGAEISWRNVKDHFRNNHLPLEVSATREIVENQAEAMGKSIEDHNGTLVDGITMASLVVQKAFERLAHGQIAPDLKDGMAAAKFLADLGIYDGEGGMDQQAIIEAFMQYHEAAQSVMSDEQFARFGAALERNPVLNALAAKYDGQVVDGEVLEETSESLAERLDNEES